LSQPGWDHQLFPLPFLQACCFLDQNQRCEIYATRPQVCREFAAGSEQCQEARRRGGLPPLLPLGGREE
jgi:Fe-S-cluster containining protein